MSYEIYLDESCHTAHEFMLLGGVVARTDRVDDLSERLAAIRDRTRSSKPLKWTNLKRARLPVYREAVDYIFDSLDRNHLHFHMMIIECKHLDHRAYNGGDRDVGLSKFINQLLIHKFARRYPAPLHVYPDHRIATGSLDDVRNMLNSILGRDWDVPDFPVKRMQFRKYRSTPMLWIPDLIIGASAYQKNGRHASPDAAPYKVELAEHVRKRAKQAVGWPSTPPGGVPRFSVWNFEFKRKRKGSRGARCA